MADRVKQAKDLLIEQYKGSTNLNGFISSFAAELQAVDNETVNLLNERGLDTAKGVNLDIIGKIVVLDRPYTDPDPEDVFTYENPDDLGKGFTDIQKTEIGGYFIGLEPLNNQRYSDEQYRFILRAKIISNTTHATLEDMHRYAEFVFGADSSIIEGIGYIDISIARPLGKQERQIINATFPLAAGVRMGDLSYSNDPNTFGFTGDNRNGGFGDLNDPDVGGVFATLVID
ncbi:DUF2612 domain-containing protein [Rufibacter sediminis]|uniref:DUF2612 domain-containing protein n=1 Tax=Rufibacter sediminis TaxID=2762756 RepID=A0ABR6VV42_9BACT|nr:DUF2612 domain-containing protein [Rufibacter sediminis]MBC3540668.1 DUF2612 domain-containing protein [Rufibacter sediminis]